MALPLLQVAPLMVDVVQHRCVVVDGDDVVVRQLVLGVERGQEVVDVDLELGAAHVEGASALRIFWQIKLPLILPTLGLVTILTFVANFNAFDLIYSVKGALAGPNYSTDILGTLFYRTFFGYQAQIGSPTMGAAVATLMFLMILMGVGVYFVLIQRKLTRFAL